MQSFKFTTKGCEKYTKNWIEKIDWIVLYRYNI
jgi:hypothetical protein